MSDITQSEANALIRMHKVPVNDKLIDLPDFGGEIEILLKSQDRQEDFILNYRRGKINLSKRNHHLRGRQVIGLVRLDLDGPPHRNPNGQEIGPRHLHLYRAGYGLKWAYEVPTTDFSNLDDTYETLEDFLRYCYIIKIPNFNKGLFS